jgi:hypothetical protein
LNLPKDASRRAMNRTHNDAMQAWKKKEKARSVACRVAKEWGEDTPTKFDSSYEEEEGGGWEVTPPPQSPPCITPPPFDDIIDRQVGIPIGECLLKQIRIGTRSMAGLPQ